MRTVLSDTELKPGLLRSPYDLTAAWFLLFLVPLASYLLLTGKSRMSVYAGIAAAGILLVAGLLIGLKKKNRVCACSRIGFLGGRLCENHVGAARSDAYGAKACTDGRGGSSV